MQKIIIHTKIKIDKESLSKKIESLMQGSDTYKPETVITIYEGETNSSYFGNPEIEMFCELFAYENPDISDKEAFLKTIFIMLNENFSVDMDKITGVIHQLNQDHYITQSEHVTIDNHLREDSFKELGI